MRLAHWFVQNKQLKEKFLSPTAQSQKKKSRRVSKSEVCATTASTRENFDDKYLQLNFKTRLPLLLPSGEDWNALKCFF